MSEATSKTCAECGGRGFRGVKGGLCATCNGTGIETTGVADNRDAWGRKYGEPQPATANATGHDGCIRGLEKANATIAEQAAEIERLRERVSGLEQLHASWADGSLAELTAERDALRAAVDHLKAERDTLRSALEIAAARSDSQSASIAYFEQESVSHDAALKEVTTERDVLRLENQRLNDLKCEAMDRYAALEAERDELRAERLERMGALEAAMRTIDAQNAQVRAMNEQLDAVTQLIVLRVKDTDHA